MPWKYYLPDYEEKEDAREIEGVTFFDSDDADDVAIRAAQDHYEGPDGWESSWPLDVVVIDEDGKEYKKLVNIRREWDRCFYIPKSDSEEDILVDKLNDLENQIQDLAFDLGKCGDAYDGIGADVNTMYRISRQLSNASYRLKHRNEVKNDGGKI